MDFIKELQWRGMLHDVTPGVEAYLAEGMRTGYIGFDPTAPSMTIGNYVQIMLLTFFQKSGHQPIALMGGATGRIGDPSGKDKERDLKSEDELDANLRHQVKQMEKFLNFEEGENKALLINNFDFYKDMNVLDFLRNVGKNLTINYMLSKDAVKSRMESGISYTEFSYQLLQAYDFLCLYRDHECTLQMGGSDQWGNITSGTEFIRRNITDGKAYAITTPLLTKSDGKKFGKSEEGNIWLDPNLTSPYKFYQFWINADDADIPKFFRYFSLRSREEIEALESSHAQNPRELKRMLAEELTERVHSKKDMQKVEDVSQILFNPKANESLLAGMDGEDWKVIAEEIPSFGISLHEVQKGVSLIDLMTDHSHISKSKGDARRSIQSNAVSVNKIKVQEIDYQINHEHLLSDGFLMIENGKKNKFVFHVSP